MRRLLTIPAVLIAMLIGVSVWSGETDLGRADFAFVNRGDHNTLDLNDMSYMQDIRIAYALWEGLYTLDPQTLQPILGTADRVHVSPDKCVYTFHIRDTARWSNGDPVVAGDFLFEWKRMLQSPKDYTYLHHYIKGAKAYEDAYADYSKAPVGKKPPEPPFTVGEEQLDDHTLRVTLEHPVTFFPALCAFPCFFPMHERSMRPFAETDPATGVVTYKPEFTRPPNLVTNGPFRLSHWEFRRRLRLTASDYYWDRANTGCKTIDEIYCAEPVAAYRLYQQGVVDWIADVDPEMAAPLLASGNRPDLHVFTAFGTSYYDLNCDPARVNGQPNPLTDIRIRQALAMSIDKTAIVRDVARLHQQVTNDYIPPGVFPGYESPKGLAYDPAAARKLLADAGYPDGKGFPQISILYDTTGIQPDVATMIRSQWKTNLHIDVGADGVDSKQFSTDHKNDHFTVSRAGWYGDYDDLSTFTDKYQSSSIDNSGKWVDKAYDDLCAKAAVEPDAAVRSKLLSQAEDRLLTQAAIIPLYTQVGAYLIRPGVTGIPLAPQQMAMFKAIRNPRN
jgi:oligopeptide transport system substrate-binding protein